MPDVTSKELNCKGLACPQPVLETRKALEELPAGARLTVIVDNPVAKENVIVFATNAGHQVEVTENNGEFILNIIRAVTGPTQAKQEKKEEKTEEGQKGEKPEQHGKVIYLITSNLFGQGSPDLGQVLMKSFFVSLAGQKTPPEALIFVNTGVYLSTQGSPVLEHLQTLAAKGTTILSCGTCLDYYKLREKLAAGRVSNMYEISERLSGTEKVITIA